jgi:hypothetical protein
MKPFILTLATTSLLGVAAIAQDRPDARQEHEERSNPEDRATIQRTDTLLPQANSFADGDTMLECFLADNPEINAKVDSGEWSKEQAMSLAKRRR